MKSWGGLSLCGPAGSKEPHNLVYVLYHQKVSSWRNKNSKNDTQDFFFLPKFSLKYMLSSVWWHNLSFSWKSIKRFFLTVRLSTMEPVIDIGPAAAGSSVLHIVINIVTRVLTQRGTFSNKNFSSLIQSVCRPLVFPVQALVSLILTEPMVACIC